MMQMRRISDVKMPIAKPKNKSSNKVEKNNNTVKVDFTS